MYKLGGDNLKLIYLIIGIISFSLGVIGVVLPILPTTPFMLLTSFCLLKSSDKLNQKFQKTRFYEDYVRTFKENKGMTMKGKMIILIPVSIILLTMFVSIDSSIMRGVIVVLLTVKVIVFSRMKTIK